MKHIQEFFDLTVSDDAMLQIEMMRPRRSSAWGAALKEEMKDYELELGVEEEVAKIFGNLIVAFAGERLYRMVWLCLGWPWSFLAALKDDAQKAATVKRFLHDRELFETLKSKVDPDSTEKDVIDRHAFGTRPVKQIDECLKAQDDECGPRLTELLIAKSKGLHVTQIVEDMNGISKNASELKACKKFRKPATLMATTIAAKLVSERHKFQEPEGGVRALLGSTALPAEAFHVDEKMCSENFEELASKKQNTPWWSPGPPRLQTPIADMAMMHHLWDQRKQDEIPNAWYGQLLHYSHNIVVGFCDPNGANPWLYEYFIPLYHWPSSGVLLWRVRIKFCGRYPAVYFEPEPAQERPEIRCVTTLQQSRIQCYRVEWRSWLWQTVNLPGVARNLKAGVRLFSDCGGPEPLLHAACRCCFWKLSRTVIMQFASHPDVNIIVPGGSSLFDTLWIMVQKTLNTGPAETLAILHQRVAAGVDDGISDALLQLDACTDLLDKTDVEAMFNQKKKTEHDQSAHADFVNEYRTKARSVHPRPKAKAKAKGRGGGGPPPLRFHFGITHAEAKRLLPPECSIWRMRLRGGWAAHCTGYARISERFGGVTEGEALKRCLERLWEMHFIKSGGDVTMCPVQGLFE